MVNEGEPKKTFKVTITLRALNEIRRKLSPILEKRISYNECVKQMFTNDLGRYGEIEVMDEVDVVEVKE